MVNMISNNKADNVTTMNLIAETNNGDGGNVIVVGSHLDSVPAGPGINVLFYYLFSFFLFK